MFDYKKLYKFLLEGFAVAISAYFILGRKKRYTELIIIGLTAAAAFAILDRHSSVIRDGMRQGSGFGIGWNMVGGDGDSKSIISDTTSNSTQTTKASSASSAASTASSTLSKAKSSSTDTDSTISSFSGTSDSSSIHTEESFIKDTIKSGIQNTADKLKSLFQ